ncbi:type II secretion system major pseudopilin GspG [Bradyrhizobium sp.]|uniref:type II secretion system major pseudopilin GspG n=1 Tax=Bradyrhizobium sp. TaxID=376 RepID=UPI001D73F129|nr:type II secretion system major pseudopilin GspG [Bradyrhizobium sp.]MBI5321175.1 type II secretion system major pseudopilin GspG [Bradyrhizobium sp.]
MINTAIDPQPRIKRRVDRHNTARAPQNSDAGFTLLELLVVVAILGLLIGLVAPVALRQLGSARTSIAQQSIERLGSILEMYKLDVGTFPTTDQGLQALITRPAAIPRWNGPYIKGDGVPLDAWGRSYLYRSPSPRTGREYDLCSKGPNGDAAENGPDIICNAS